jgi:hypothetical protein
MVLVIITALHLVVSLAHLAIDLRGGQQQHGR